jgi:ATP-dependent Clp protease ATP-binding subunit ClpX
VANRIGKKHYGFGVEATKKEPEDTAKLLLQVEPDDLLRFGLIPELIGRLPVIAPLGELNEEALYRILLEPKNALTKQYKRLLAMDGTALEFEEEALGAIVQKAMKRHTGARGLRAVMEEIMLDIMYKIPSMPEIKSCLITKEAVIQNQPPIFTYEEIKKRA